MKRLIASAAAFLIAAPALAADLGGNCCADLEERVAELEATTARKGTRKMSLTLSGQVNQSLLWFNIDGLGDDKRIGDNTNSPSVFRMVGEAKLEKFSAGFIYEFGVGDDLAVRHAAVWLGSAAGKVWLGQTSSATDGIAEISTANTVVASRMLTLDYGVALGLPIGFDGHRYQLVKYETPTLMGFTGSAAYAPNASLAGGDIWDAAARYAGEFGGFRVAAGIGLREDDLTGMASFNLRTVVGSASVMHMATGLFLNASGGNMSDTFMGDGLRMWHVQGGIERNVFGFGATTLYAELADTSMSGFSVDVGFWGGGVVQSIDALSTDLYVSFRQHDVLGVDATAVLAGARVKF